MHIYIFIGTTAELIKLAPVIKELNKRKKEFTIITTGQNDIHFEEYESMLGTLRIISAVTPKSVKSSVVKFLLWAIRTFFSLLIGMRKEFKGLNKKNSYFIVHGDTVSSLMGSLVAFLYGLQLVHIESGLRSFNFFEPFPEEICRYIISRLADVHFCPNNWCEGNLKSMQGIKINTFQNTLIETFREVTKRKSHHPFVQKMLKQKKKYFVMVIHRQEHVVFGKDKTNTTLEVILKSIPNNFLCVFLVHDLSVKFINSIESINYSNSSNLIKSRRLPYVDFMQLIGNAEFLITDGGSNQEEAYYMGKPCLLIRNSTERIEGLKENVIVSKSEETVIKNFISNYTKYKRKPIRLIERPSKIIVDYLL